MSNGKLTRGRFIESLYEPPMFKPPFTGKKLIKTGAKIEFVLEEYLYDAGILRKHKRNQKKLAEEAKPKPMPKSEKKPTYKDPYEEGTSKGPKIQVRLKPFLENTKRQYSDEPFYKGNGIDFYIDGARFLPDNVTVSKIILNVLTQDGNAFVKAQHGLPELETPSYSPGFKMKAELRMNYFSPTCIALISIETIDNSNGQVRAVGYSAINLFVDSQTNQPPVSESDVETILIEGAYQLPIHCQEPNITKPFTLDKITKLDRIPCASLLVRIVQAPLSADALMVLSKASVPEKDWEAKGVMISPPAYTGGHYNTERIQLTNIERSLFPFRQERIDQTVKQKATSLMEREGTQNPSDAEILRWIDNKLVKLNSTELLDMTYFARYLPEFGFKIIIDGFHNTPEKLPYVCVSCLNPPGALFQTPPQFESVHMNSKLNWESPITAPQFIEEVYDFYDMSVKKNLSLLLEVRTVSFGKKEAPYVKTIGWTALPIFNANGYVQSGCYQLPIFKGNIPPDLLEYITHNEAWPHLMELLNMKKSPIQLLEPMSAVVRLVDGQREGHFQRLFDYGRMNYKYLPKPKAHLYMYTAAVEGKLKSAKKLSSILPKKVTPEEYNQKVTTAFKEVNNFYKCP